MGAASTEVFDLSGSLAVVVGGSEGIGAAMAEAFVAAGARVVIAGRNRSRLTATARRVADAGADVVAETVDVRAPDSVRDLAATVESREGTPAILVNSAGRTETKAAFDLTVEEWDAVHETQLRGTFLACQAFGRAMASAGYGKIINLSSTWAATVGPGRSAYCAAKAGVSHLTAALAAEWAADGVRVNAIAPTATRTPGVERRLEGDAGREEYLRSRIPLGRLAEPYDLVGAALFLAAPTSDFVTGHTLFVDGGWRFSK